MLLRISYINQGILISRMSCHFTAQPKFGEHCFAFVLSASGSGKSNFIKHTVYIIFIYLKQINSTKLIKCIMESPNISQGTNNDSLCDMVQRPIHLPLGKRRKFRKGTKGGKPLTPCEAFWQNFIRENISVECSSNYHTLKCHTSALHKFTFLENFPEKNEK